MRVTILSFVLQSTVVSVFGHPRNYTHTHTHTVHFFAQVWSVRIDICILDNAGNLIDASAVAMMAALLYFRKSAVEVVQGNEVRLLASHESEPTPLSSSTLLVFNGGESAIFDPTEREEMALDCRISFSFNIHKELCMLQKLGGIAMSQASIVQFARSAFENIEARIKTLKKVRECVYSSPSFFVCGFVFVFGFSRLIFRFPFFVFSCFVYDFRSHFHFR
jgi:hypothetical protein